LAFAEAFEVTNRNEKYPQDLDKISCPIRKSRMYDMQTAKPSRKMHPWLKRVFSMMQWRLEARETCGHKIYGLFNSTLELFPRPGFIPLNARSVKGDVSDQLRQC